MYIRHMQKYTLSRLGMKFLIVFLFVSHSLVGHSQNSKIKYFATLGVSWSKFYDELGRKDQFEYLLKPEFGINVQYSISNSFGIGSSILYQGRGSKLNNGSLTLNYITLPLYATFYIGGNKDINLSIGTYLSMIINKNTNGNINNNIFKDISDIDYGFDFKFAFPTFKIGTNRISVYSRFQYGLNDVYNPLKYLNPSSSYYIWHRIKNYSIGIKYPIR